MEELGESVWSVGRQENEREDQREGVQRVVRPALVYGADTSMGIEEGSGNGIRGHMTR